MRILLLVASGPSAGTGHRARMQILKARLEATGHHELLWQDVDPYCADIEWASDARPGRFDRIVLDARDLDPLPLLAYASRVIAIDNRSVTREAKSAVYFHDTLLHPQTPLAITRRNALIAPDLLEATRGNARFALAYVGGWEGATALDPAIKAMSANRQLKGYRIGGPPPDDTDLLHESRVDRAEWVQLLCEAGVLLCYAGVTLLEACYLGVPVLLFSPDSPVHSNLNNYAHEALGIPILNWNAANAEQDIDRTEWRPEGTGYERLLELILN